MKNNIDKENSLEKKIDFDAIKKLKFDERGLIPAIAQDVNTKEVLMLAYMKQTGGACHTGNYSCFFNLIMEK